MPLFRHKSPPVDAIRLTEPLDFTNSSDAPVHGEPGDWAIRENGEPREIIPHAEFCAHFEAVSVDGMRMMQDLRPPVPPDHRQQILIGQQFRPAAVGDPAVGPLPVGAAGGAVFDQNLIRPADRDIRAVDGTGAADRAGP